MHPNFLLNAVGTALMALVAGAAGDPTRTSVLASPEFSGTLFINGVAATGAEVLIGFSGDYDHPCSGLPIAAIVDANGHFSAPAKTFQMTPEVLRAVPYQSFQNYVCFSYNGETLVDSMFVTYQNYPYKYIGNCTTPYTDGYEKGMCRWRKEHA
jgi:hypothetical protein